MVDMAQTELCRAFQLPEATGFLIADSAEYLICNTVKGQCHKIFGILIFHESKPSGPLINRLKWFCVKIRFRGDIRDSVQANTARSWTLCRLTLCEVGNFLKIQK